MLTYSAGFLMGLSLIVAIGAQNVFVLRQGLRRELVGPVVVICAASDAVLILVGVAGLGWLVASAPWLVDAARWGGAAFLLGYAALAARRAMSPAAAGLDAAVAGDSRGSTEAGGGVQTKPRTAPVVASALALTWLNPHVYLDTVFLLGSVAATHGAGRWVFAAGAVTGSVVWFTALGFGARGLGRWLRGPRAWRILDAGIAVVMVVLAGALLRG